MNLFYPDHLNILFPQWQGSGFSNTLFHGAKKIEHYFSDIQFTEIAVPENQNLTISNHILGYDAIVEQYKAAQKSILEIMPHTIFTLGGDCGVEIAPVSYLNKHYNKNMALVWLDAHGDLNTPKSSPSKHFHGMPLRTLCGESDPDIEKACISILETEQVILAGVREFDPPELDYIQRNSMAMVSVETLGEKPDDLSEKIINMGFNNVYLHIDLDVLDPVSYQNSKHPTPRGLLFETLIKVISNIADKLNVVGLSILEFVPHKNTGLKEIKTILDLFV